MRKLLFTNQAGWYPLSVQICWETHYLSKLFGRPFSARHYTGRDFASQALLLGKACLTLGIQASASLRASGCLQTSLHTFFMSFPNELGVQPPHLWEASFSMPAVLQHSALHTLPIFLLMAAALVNLLLHRREGWTCSSPTKSTGLHFPLGPSYSVRPNDS